MKTIKVTPRAIVEWQNGLDHGVKIHAVADTLEEAEEIEKRLKKALQQTAEKE